MSRTRSALVLVAYCALVLAAGLAVGTAPSRADEQVVLPYDCRVIGGSVRARPSSDQAYRIYGSRDEDVVQACPSGAADRCPAFKVQRFTMSCGQGQVSWAEFYAAISSITDRRAILQNGQIRYRVGERWRARDNYGFDDPFDERGGSGDAVALQPGFAPVAGTQAIFMPLDDRVAALEDRGIPDPPMPPEPRPAPQAEVPAPVPAPKPATKAAEPPAQQPADKLNPTPSEPAPVAAGTAPPASPAPPSVPAATPSPAAAAAAAPVVTAPTPATPTSEPPAAASASDPIAPTILNSPAAAKVSQSAAAQSGGSQTVVAAKELTPPPVAAPAPVSNAGSPSGSAGFAPAMSPLVFAVALAAATLAVLLVILKRQSASAAATGFGHAPASPREPQLPGFEPPAPATSQELIVRPETSPAVSGSTPAMSPGGMPVTRADALAVLGLNDGATEAAIRKVVEGLRQSWHPDTAPTGIERAAREAHLKRINVAADILLRRPAA